MEWQHTQKYVIFSPLKHPDSAALTRCKPQGLPLDSSPWSDLPNQNPHLSSLHLVSCYHRLPPPLDPIENTNTKWRIRGSTVEDTDEVHWITSVLLLELRQQQGRAFFCLRLWPMNIDRSPLLNSLAESAVLIQCRLILTPLISTSDGHRLAAI